jgi:hypothetical protein
LVIAEEKEFRIPGSQLSIELAHFTNCAIPQSKPNLSNQKKLFLQTVGLCNQGF